MIFQYMEGGLNLICRHANNKCMAKSNYKQSGKVSPCTLHKDISITFVLASLLITKLSKLTSLSGYRTVIFL